MYMFDRPMSDFTPRINIIQCTYNSTYLKTQDMENMEITIWYKLKTIKPCMTGQDQT